MGLPNISEIINVWNQHQHSRHHFLLDLRRYADAQYNKGSPVLSNASYDALIALMDKWRKSIVTSLSTNNADSTLDSLSLQELQDIKECADYYYKLKTPVLSNAIYDRLISEINKRTASVSKLSKDVIVNCFVVANWTDTQLFDILYIANQTHLQAQRILQNKQYFIVEREHTMRETITNLGLKINTALESSFPKVPFPSNWNFPIEAVDIIELPKNGSEYQSLKTGLLSSLSANVHSIKRIQNYGLYRMCYYTQLINATQRKINIAQISTHTLYHGCPTGAGVNEIIANGFYQRFCPGGLIGDGVYFALNASYSNSSSYVLKLPDNSKQLFIVQVFTGLSTPYNQITHGKLTQPPAGFDSVNDGPQSMFCIFNHLQAYPAYVINYSGA